METKNSLPANAEVRFLNPDIKIEKRAKEGGGESRMVVGYAFKWDVWSDPIGGWFREKIAKGALEGADYSDVVAVLNHDLNQLLARTGSTLSLTVDDTGLLYEFEAPATTAGNDLIVNLDLKNIRHSSFRFIVKEDQWKFSNDQNAIDERTILKFERIIDVSPVVFPAYPDATVAKRNRDSNYEKQNPKQVFNELAAAERDRAITIINKTIN